MNAKHTYVVGAVIIVLCGWVISAFGVEFVKEKVATVDSNAERVAIMEHDLSQHKVEDNRRWDTESKDNTEMKADIKILLREVSEMSGVVKNLKTIEDE